MNPYRAGDRCPCCDSAIFNTDTGLKFDGGHLSDKETVSAKEQETEKKPRKPEPNTCGPSPEDKSDQVNSAKMPRESINKKPSRPTATKTGNRKWRYALMLAVSLGAVGLFLATGPDFKQPNNSMGEGRLPSENDQRHRPWAQLLLKRIMSTVYQFEYQNGIGERHYAIERDRLVQSLARAKGLSASGPLMIPSRKQDVKIAGRYDSKARKLYRRYMEDTNRPSAIIVDAIENYIEAIAYAKGNPIYRSNLALAYVRAGKPALAMQAALASIERSDGKASAMASALFLIGKVFDEQLKDPERAEPLFTAAINLRKPGSLAYDITLEKLEAYK